MFILNILKQKVAENQRLNLIYGPAWSNLELLNGRFKEIIV